MFPCRNLSNRINNIRERAFQIVNRYCITSFEELLKKDKSVTFNQINLQILVTKIFKIKIGLKSDHSTHKKQFHGTGISFPK